MKKNIYSKPNITVIKSNTERLLTTVSKTKTYSADGSTTDGPGWGGTGEGDDMNSKKNNAWSTWDD